MTRLLLSKYNKRRGQLASMVALVTACFVAANVQADTSVSNLPQSSSFQYHGAFTQGAFHTSDNNFYGQSDDDISFDFTELSLNASYKLLPNIRLAGQVLYRQAGATSDDVVIDYLFVDGNFYSSEETNAGLRLGRVKNPYGLYNDARDIAFTRPGILLAQSIYPDTLRDLFVSTDSLMFYANHFTDSGQWSLELGVGKPRVDKLANLDLDGVDDEEVLLGRLLFEDSSERWRVAFSAMRGELSFLFDVSADLGLPPMPPIKTPIVFDLYLLSLQYNWHDWTFSGEYQLSMAGSDSPGVEIPSRFGPMFIDLDFEENGEAYYLQAEKRLSAQWTALARFDVDYSEKDDRSGEAYAQQRGGEAYSRYSKDYTLGLRWNFRSDMMLNFEYHNIEGASWLPLLDNPDGPSSKYWDMVAVTFSYRF